MSSGAGHARHTGGAWALAAAARCHGLLAADEEFERWFETALDRHQGNVSRAAEALGLSDVVAKRRQIIDGRRHLTAKGTGALIKARLHVDQHPRDNLPDAQQPL